MLRNIFSGGIVFFWGGDAQQEWNYLWVIFAREELYFGRTCYGRIFRGEIFLEEGWISGDYLKNDQILNGKEKVLVLKSKDQY